MPTVRSDYDHPDDEYYGSQHRAGRPSLDQLAKEQLAKTPWWMVSVGFHAVLFMVGYFVMAQVVETTRPFEVVTSLPDAVDEFDEEEIDDEVEDPSPIDADETEIPSPDITDEVAEPNTDENETDIPSGDPDNQSAHDLDARFNQSAIGVGGGAAGKWGMGGKGGNRFAGRRGGRRGKPPGDKQVGMGLEWLAKHQSKDGSWSCNNFSHRCAKNICDGAGSNAEYTPGTTGLALLAFLGAGHTHTHGSYKNVVRRGVKYLRSIQTPDGCVGAKALDGHYIYNHAIAAMALAESYGMTESASLKRPAQQAVDFLINAQNPYLGWRYGIRPGDNDTSITGWAVLALKSAKLADLNVAPEAFAGARNWVDKVTDDSYYKTGYTQKGDAGARAPEGAKYQPTEAMTAAGLCVRIFTGAAKDEPEVKGAASLLRNMPPKWDAEEGNDFYYWYYGTLAMFQVGGNDWKVWERGMKEAIVKTQRRGGDENGSWDPHSAWGHAGGRVYATAINVLSLEIYYRYSKVLGGGR